MRVGRWGKIGCKNKICEDGYTVTFYKTLSHMIAGVQRNANYVHNMSTISRKRREHILTYKKDTSMKSWFQRLFKTK